jgi:hypothetical protein
MALITAIIKHIGNGGAFMRYGPCMYLIGPVFMKLNKNKFNYKEESRKQQRIIKPLFSET